MSYSIEYNRVFLKSGEGITPCVLSGSSNCHEQTSSGRWRRDRSWGIFHNMIGVTEADMLESVKPWLGGYQEHWKKGGKWVDDAGLIRWVKSGVRGAVSLEALLETNRMSYVNCRVCTWTPGMYTQDIFSARCSTTEELDAWIREARDVIRKQKETGKDVYPVISELPEDLRRPRANTPSLAIVKKGNSYLVSHTDKETRWCRNAEEAEVIPWEEAEALLRHSVLFRGARLVDVARKKEPNNAVIRFKTGPYAGSYIRSRSRTRIHMSHGVEGAAHYANEKVATVAMRKIQTVVTRYGELEVVILT